MIISILFYFRSNTPMKTNAGEDQAMELHHARVQIEDIESILSHLHGT